MTGWEGWGNMGAITEIFDTNNIKIQTNLRVSNG